MDLFDQLPFLNDLPEFAKPIALDLILVVFALLLIVVLRWLLTGILLRPLRVLVRRTNSEVDDLVLEQCIQPMRIAVVGISLMITVNLFMFGAEIQQIAETIARSLVIGSLFFAVIRIFDVFSLHPALLKQVTGLTIPERLLPFLNTVVKYLIIALGAIFVLQELNFDVAALIASLGVVGIGIALASKDTVSNLFGFAAIVTDDPFKVGDFIKTPNVSGIVETVGVRSTRVRQLDQALVTVPNNLLTNAVVLNWSRREKRRLDMTLGFTYSTTSEQMRAVVLEICDLLQRTENIDPESVIVNFIDFSASSLDVRVICQVLLADWKEFSALKESLMLNIMGIAEGLGISFAFPSQSLYIEGAPGLSELARQAVVLREQVEEPADEASDDDRDTSRIGGA